MDPQPAAGVKRLRAAFVNTNSWMFPLWWLPKLSMLLHATHGCCYTPLHNGALGLAEALLLVAPSGVGHKHSELGLHGDVVLQGDVVHLHIVKAVCGGMVDMSA